MKKKLVTALFALSFMALPISPLPAGAAEVCVGTECSVEFSFTGNIQSWTPPTQAKNLRFEIFGAAGGRGGLGGSVSGTLTTWPNTLYIVVGSEGQVGANASGGYNGGGAAGGNRGNEGSGGGATDIRLGQGLDSRIVVAGGGGGAGGYAGGAGGAGGGTSGSGGETGQGGGGGGGTQSSGGGAGSSNGGSSASPGYFGQGGTGGTSWNAGGGGGGGGWYGGGGGGADDNACCADGGGGGGGSSYVSSSYVSAISHAQGVNAGNGRAVFYYSMPAQVSLGSAEQLSSTTAKFSFLSDVEITDSLESTFVLSGEGCRLGAIDNSGLRVDVLVHDCTTGEVSLSLSANSLFANSAPDKDLKHVLAFDRTGPTVNWLEQATDFNTTSIVLQLEVTDTAVELTTELFSSTGCDVASVILGDYWAVKLENCQQGEQSVAVDPSAIVDEWGNPASVEPLVFAFYLDSVAPELSWDPPVSVGENPFEITLILTQSELTDLGFEDIQFFVPEGCEFFMETVGLSAEIYGSCGYGEYAMALPANSVRDALGNLGPATDQVISFTFSEPEVINIPELPQEIVQQITPIDNSVPATPSAEPTPDPEYVEPAETVLEPVEPEGDLIEELVDVISDLVVDVPETENIAPQQSRSASDPVDDTDPAPIANTSEPTLEPGNEIVEVTGSSESTAPTAEVIIPIANFESTEMPETEQNYGWVWLISALGLAVLGFGAYRVTGR